ncbi:hypothetical protein [Hydrogenimonas sp.]
MKKILMTALLLATTLLDAGSLEKIYTLYNQKHYKQACQYGLHIFNKYKKNSKFVMLYGFSCLKADYIDRLAVPLTGLRATKSERANASYFATILLQKKLLYHALIDNVDISYLVLPKTDYVLSKVFDLFTQKAYKKVDDKFYLKPEEANGILYVLYIQPYGKIKKMVLEERLEGNIIKTHKYW